MNATTTDLRRKTGKILKAVDRGETVHVLDRGKERATIVPPAIQAKPKRGMRDHPSFGMWSDRKDMEDVHAWLDKMKRRRFRDL